MSALIAWSAGWLGFGLRQVYCALTGTHEWGWADGTFFMVYPRTATPPQRLLTVRFAQRIEHVRYWHKADMLGDK